MANDEDMQRILRNMQTSMYDQMNALKSDVQKAVGDADAAVEISANLEKNVNALESMQEKIKNLAFDSTKTAILDSINHDFLILSMLGIMRVITAGTKNDKDKQIQILEQMLKLIKTNSNSVDEIRDATEVKQLESLCTQIDDKYNDIKKSLVSILKANS